MSEGVAITKKGKNFYINKAGRPDVGKHGQPVRDTAFFLWWEVCDRDLVKVAEMLESNQMYRDMAGLAPGDKGPSYDSIRRWSMNEQWEIKAADVMRDAAPWKIKEASLILAYATSDAAKTVVRLAKGQGTHSATDKVAGENAWRILNMALGDNLSVLAKPVVDKALDMENVESLEQLAELERQVQSGE